MNQNRRPDPGLFVVHGTRDAYERFGCTCDHCNQERAAHTTPRYLPIDGTLTAA